MKDPIREYHDFIMSNEDKDQYVDPIIMGDHRDWQTIYRIKSHIEIAMSKISYWFLQVTEALAHVAVGGLIGVGFITVIEKLAHITF